MPENKILPVNRSQKEGGSQINPHLDNKPIDELADVLTDMWDAADDLTYSAAEMDACLEEIEQIEAAPEFDVDASLNRFLDKHSWLVECTSRTSEKNRSNTSRWKPSIAAAVAILVVLGSLVTAQALGIDVFGAIARWTDETFRFTSPSQNETDPEADIQNSNDQSPDGEYTSLQDALDACGIKQNVIPQYLPEGFSLENVSVSTLPSDVAIDATYTSNDRRFRFVITRYNSPETVGQAIFEKDSEDIILYEKGGVTVYIMSNNRSRTAAWMPEDLIICAIMGDLTVEEIEAIIDSM